MLPAQMSHGKPRGGGAAAPPTTSEAQARGPAQPEPGDQSRGSRSMHPASACSPDRCRPTVECYYPGPPIAHRRLPRLPRDGSARLSGQLGRRAVRELI